MALGIGIFSIWGLKNTVWLVQQDVQMPEINNLRLGSADIWIFMALTLFIIAQIFKKGIEIQDEHELIV